MRGPVAILGMIAVTALSACSEAPADVSAPPVPQRLKQLGPSLSQRIRDTLEAIADDGTDLDTRLDLCFIYAANGLNESARGCLEQVIELGAEDPRAWYHLAHARSELGDLDGALEAAAQAAALEPDYAPAHWQQGLWRLERAELDAAEAAFRRAVDVDPDTSAGRLGLARVHLDRGAPEEAARLLEAYVASSEANRSYALQLLVRAYNALGRSEDAERALQARRTAPAWDDAWRRDLSMYAESIQAELDRAKEAASAGDFDGAIEILERLRRGRSVAVGVYNNLGLSYLASDRLDLALAVLEEGVSAHPGSLEGHHLLAVACQIAGGRATGEERRRFEQRAVEHAQEALRIDPAYVPTIGLQGEIFARRGDLPAAIDAYHEAARWDPDNPQWHYQAGALYGTLRQWESAAECLERVTATSPSYEDAMTRLGVVYLVSGRFDAAAATLQKALSVNPERREQIMGALGQLDRLRAEQGAREP